jgi:phage gp29-like protein
MSTILGPDGQPLSLRETLAAIREPQTAGVGYLAGEFDQHPAKGLTPAKLATIMRNAEQGDLVGQIELADDMEERDAHLYAELGKRRGAITALEWSIEEPEGASSEEKNLTAQVRDWFDMLTANANGVNGGFELVLATMTDAMLKGFAPQEMVWTPQPDGSGRQVLVPHVTAQPQRWFTVSADRRRFLLRSRETMQPGTEHLPSVMGEELRPYAWLQHVHPARNGYLARMSLSRVLVWPYLFKNYAVRDLAEFLEIYGLPLRLGKYPTGATDDEKRKLLQAVTQIGHNAAGIIPASMALEFQAAAAGTEVPFAAMWDRLDAAESKAILGQTLSSSEGQHGTQALGQVHEEVRMDIREADARLVENTIGRQLIQALCVLNVAGVNPRRLPKLSLDTGEPEDLAAYAENMPLLAKGGMRIGLKWLHEKLRIPEPEDGEEVFQEPEPVAAPGAAGAVDPKTGKPMPAVKPPAAMTTPQRQALTVDQRQALMVQALAQMMGAPAIAAQPEPDLIDELVAEQSGQWKALLGGMMEPLIVEMDKAVAAGETLQAFTARLPELVAKLDAQPLTQSLARSAFSARLAGEAGLDLSTTPQE